MDAEATNQLARALIILSMVVTPFAESRIISSAFEAIGRNPKLESTLFNKAIIAVALVESTAIYALVAFFTLAV